MRFDLVHGEVVLGSRERHRLAGLLDLGSPSDAVAIFGNDGRDVDTNAVADGSGAGSAVASSNHR